MLFDSHSLDTDEYSLRFLSTNYFTMCALDLAKLIHHSFPRHTGRSSQQILARTIMWGRVGGLGRGETIFLSNNEILSLIIAFFWGGLSSLT